MSYMKFPILNETLNAVKCLLIKKLVLLTSINSKLSTKSFDKIRKWIKTIKSGMIAFHFHFGSSLCNFHTLDVGAF